MPPRWMGGRPPQLAKKSEQCRLSVAMTSTCPTAAAPLRWPAKGRSPACGLPAATVSGAPPRQRLATGFVAPAIAVPPAPTFGPDWPRRVQHAACAVVLRTTASSAASKPNGSLCSTARRPLRGKCSAALRIQHNSLLRKIGQSLRRLRLVADRCAPCGFA